MPEAAGREDYAGDEARWSALMASAQRGHEGDYRALLHELSRALQRYLASRLGPVEWLEDCVQETLIAVHEARHTYDPGRPFRPWLFAIARHKAIDSLRRRRPSQEAQAVEEQALVGPGDAMEASIAGGRMLRSLSPDHREAIMLTKVVGLTSAEAASRLAISEGALKVRVHRGVSRLRQLLEAEEP